MTGFMPSPWPLFDDEQVAAVTEVLRSGKVNYWTGTVGREFEQGYSTYLGRRHSIALANGTVALELALEAFEIGGGDEVIVPARTYVASASCVVMRGARPVVVDVDRDSQCLTAATVEAAITDRTRAVVVVHLGGWPADMDPLMQLARERNLIVIEDCAQAHGAFYKGRPVGSIGDAGAFSFCQDKIITTGGEGGLLALDDEKAWRRAWAFKDIGRSYAAAYERKHPPGFRWLTESFGTNWRMTEMQAALGRIQLRRLPRWVEQRTANAAILREMLTGLPALRIPAVPPGDVHAFYRFYAFVRPNWLKSDWSRDRILGEIESAGIPCGVGSCSEIYLEKAFVERGWGLPSRLPVARELGETSVMFLVHPTLTEEQMRAMAGVVRGVVEAASVQGTGPEPGEG
jgi:dTDP-4-amino-4,6-dideoxygalactose transaminase